MSFQQALSGLSAAQVSLDTIGNNVANASTVGFKGSTAEFADLYANTLNGAASDQVGMGVRVAQVAQSFSQGNITTTSNPLDIAINGEGFLRVDNGGAISYSRNGQLQIDKNGFLVNSSGAKITGYGVLPAVPASANSPGTPPTMAQGTLTDLQVNTTTSQPNATALVSSTLNLNATEPSLAQATNPIAFDPTNPNSYSNSTTATVYDSQGNTHNLTTYYVNNTAAGSTTPTWTVYATLDQGTVATQNNALGIGTTQAGITPPSVATPYPSITLTFNSSGALTSPTAPADLFLSYPTPGVTSGNWTANPLNITLNLGNTTNYNTAFAVNTLSQDGYGAGQLTNFSIGSDGVINGNFTNGQSQPLGQIVLANFTDPNALTPIGNNAWGQSAGSGQPLVGVPGSGVLGQLQGSAVESSTVDLTAELVNMITAQRAYQANAQTIKTEDQILQTITSLR